MTALVIGATGLVGNALIRQLLKDSRFTKVIAFTRRSAEVKHGKFVENLVDFAKMPEWQDKIHGDVAFSALGTTKAQAGSIEAQYTVDYTYQAEFAKACAQNGVASFVLVSSMSANAKSAVPYTRMKGELEDFIKTLGFKKFVVLRPGPLEGFRKQRRWSEELSVPIMKLVSKLKPLNFLHPVSGDEVAATAIQSAFADESFRIVESKEVHFGLGAQL